MDPQATNRFISEWLARAHPVPAQARAEWSNQGVALLPLGGRFAAVRMRADMVYAAVGSDDPDKAAAAMAELLAGPVIHDYRSTGATYYALIQAHAGMVWAHEEVAPCLGQGTYLGVPRIDRCEPPGTYWTVRPRYDGNLCRPCSVALLVQAGHERLAAEP